MRILMEELRATFVDFLFEEQESETDIFWSLSSCYYTARRVVAQSLLKV
jgi:hypothetical protein